jgi:hypothetical protein
MPSTDRTVMKMFQKPLVKSAMVGLPVQAVDVFVGERQLGRRVEVAFFVADISPPHDADEGDEADHRHDAAGAVKKVLDCHA